MKKLNKVVALVLALAMVFSLAACQNAPDETQAPTQPTSATEATKAPEETKEDIPAWKVEHPTWLCEEKQTLTVMLSQGGSTVDPSNDVPFWSWLEEYTNVHIEWILNEKADHKTIVKTVLAAGEDMPDIMHTNDVSTAVDACQSGVLVDLMDYWDTCFPNTQAYFEGEGMDYLTHMRDGYGHLPSIAGPVQPIEGHGVWMYNKDWMEKLDAEVPQTLDEFTELLRKMKAAGDINGNGVDDEIPFSSTDASWAMRLLQNTFGIEQYSGDFFAAKDGKVYCEYTTDMMKNLLTYMSMLYEEKLLDNTLFGEGAAITEKVANNQVGVISYYSSFALTYGRLTEGGIADPDSEQFIMGPALSSEYNGNTQWYSQRIAFTSGSTGITRDCENVELAARWLDTVFCDPAAMRARIFGFEGEHYELDSEGNIKLIYKEDGSWSTKDFGGGQFGISHVQTADQINVSKWHLDWYMDTYDALRENCEWRMPSVLINTLKTAEEQEIHNLVATGIKDYYEEMRDKFIMGQESIEDEWDTYLSTMDSLGVKDWESVYQSIYDRTNK